MVIYAIYYNKSYYLIIVKFQSFYSYDQIFRFSTKLGYQLNIYTLALFFFSFYFHFHFPNIYVKVSSGSTLFSRYVNSVNSVKIEFEGL